MKKKKRIFWRSIEVLVAKIKPTPNNFKLATEEGTYRFNTSINDYGLAGNVIVNQDYSLIDGNSRVDKAKELGDKKIWVSIPDRMLTPKEYIEFAAMIDAARKGEVDIKRIKDELGNTADFFKKWGLAPDEEQLRKLEEMDSGKITPNGKKITEIKTIEVRNISLIFTPEEAKKYLEIAESLYTKFKVDNITDLSMKVLLYAKKQFK